MTDWMSKAACRQHDPTMWHDREQRGDAVHVCLSHCPVLGRCRIYARDFRPPRWADLIIGGELWVSHHDKHAPAVRQPMATSAACTACRSES